MALSSLALLLFATGPRQPPPPEVDWAAIVRGILALMFLGGAASAIVINWVRVKERRKAARQARWQSLVARFGLEIANRIDRNEVWQGQTVDMLYEARGRPMAMDEEVLKTKRRQIYKYDMIARGRFGLRVTVENGVVVGWDHKG